MEISYTIKDLDKRKIIDKFGMQKGGKTELFLSNTCFKRMTKYVPYDTGALASTVTVKPGSVTYNQPYAHRQYTTNKGKGIRGRYWDRKMVANEITSLSKEVENYAKSLKGSS